RRFLLYDWSNGLRELGCGDSLREIPAIAHGVRLTSRIEESGASITDCKAAVGLLFHPIPAPAIVDAVTGRRHAATAARVDQECHATPGLGAATILSGNENELRGR